MIRVLLVGKSPSVALRDLRRILGHVDVARAPFLPIKKYDIIVAQEPTRRCGLPTYVLAKLTKTPWICGVHADYVDFLNIRERALALWLLKRATYARAINRKIFYDLKELGIKNVIYLPSTYIRTDIFKPMKPHAKRKPIVLFMGRLVSQKNPKLLLETFANVRREVRDAKLWIIGRGPLENYMRQTAKRLGIEDSVRFFIGWASWHELAKIHNEASVLLCTSLYEGGPRVVFEAAACATPSVTTPVGITLEALKDGKEVFIVNQHNNPQAMADKTIQLLNDPYLREEMGLMARKVVESKFEWNRLVKRYAYTLIKLVRGCTDDDLIFTPKL